MNMGLNFNTFQPLIIDNVLKSFQLSININCIFLKTSSFYYLKKN